MRALLRTSLISSLVLLFQLGLPFAAAYAADGGSDRGDISTVVATAPAPKAAPSYADPSYKVAAGLDGDIFPVFANFGSMLTSEEREFAAVSVTVRNTTNALLRNRIRVQVPGWSDPEIQTVEVAAGEARTFKFSPAFLPRFYSNREIVAATVGIEVSDMDGRSLYSATAPVRLRSVDDMFWGSQFKYAPFIASWVTPHDEQVERILSRAKELTPGRRLPGYESWKNSQEQEKSTFAQAKAIYLALQQQGVSYVRSSLTFGENQGVTQRVRMPRESLAMNAANCIDGAVMFASLFENLEMEPVVVLIPGHALVGVRVAKGSSQYLFMDTVLTGRASFESAVAAAERGLARYGPSRTTRIPIRESRNARIYPMPIPAQ